MTELEKVAEYAKNNEIAFDNIELECKWHGFNVYTAVYNEGGDYFIGLPKYILVNKKGALRMATTDEVYKILESLPD